MKLRISFILLFIMAMFLVQSTFAASYTDNGDGTIIDNDTTLMWQQQDDGVAKTWEDAISYCENLALGLVGYHWRLPQIKELNSLVDTSRSKPAINTSYFPSTQQMHYWSSTTIASDTSKAWAVDFNSGTASLSTLNTYGTKTGSNYVRCVR